MVRLDGYGFKWGQTSLDDFFDSVKYSKLEYVRKIKDRGYSLWSFVRARVEVLGGLGYDRENGSKTWKKPATPSI
jgi:hypothetical protein